MSEETPVVPVQPDPVYLRSTSAVSLHERFSHVMVDQPGDQMTFDPVSMASCSPQLVLQVKRKQLVLQRVGLHLRRRRRRRRKRRSVWARLGWQQVTRRRLSNATRPGFWSFRNKYSWRARSTCTCSGNLRSRLAQRFFLMTKSVQRTTAGGTGRSLTLQRGGASAMRGRSFSRGYVPSRKQLDAELDRYMSQSKSRLDQELEDYMSRSRSRLDAELDDYMMGGQSDLLWD